MEIVAKISKTTTFGVLLKELVISLIFIILKIKKEKNVKQVNEATAVDTKSETSINAELIP